MMLVWPKWNFYTKVYYKTVKDKSTRQRRGTVVKQQQQNKRSRIMRKKIDRRAKALELSTWADAPKKEMALTLTAEYISSEEELEYPPSPYKNVGYVRTVRKLYWRPNHVTSRLSILDNMYWDKIA